MGKSEGEAQAQRTAAEIVNASDVRRHWGDIVDRVAREQARILVEENGRPVAAIVSAKDLARLNRLDAERERDVAILSKMGKAFEEVPVEELEQEVAQALAEVRAEMRAERTEQQASAAKSA